MYTSKTKMFFGHQVAVGLDITVPPDAGVQGMEFSFLPDELVTILQQNYETNIAISA